MSPTARNCICLPYTFEQFDHFAYKFLTSQRIFYEFYRYVVRWFSWNISQVTYEVWNFDKFIWEFICFRCRKVLLKEFFQFRRVLAVFISVNDVSPDFNKRYNCSTCLRVALSLISCASNRIFSFRKNLTRFFYKSCKAYVFSVIFSW